MNLQILIPTINKTKDEILDLCKSTNIGCDCIIANQNGINEEYSFSYNGYNVYVICTATRGVSKNRNILLDNLTSDIGLMIDDDCIMHLGYTDVVKNFFTKHKDAEFVLFNGNLINADNTVSIHNRRTKRVKKYYEISYAGAPGLCFKKKSIDRLNLFYDESLGVPNYVEAGEDTVFHNAILKKGGTFYRCNEIIFEIKDNFTKSTYFEGVDKRYIETRGYVTYYIHPLLYRLYALRHCLRFKKANKSLKLKEIFVYFSNGVKMCKSKKSQEKN